MNRFEYGGYVVNICTDIIEWAQEFYGMPGDAELLDKEEMSRHLMGFAQVEDKEIWIFVPRYFEQEDLATTIAHELGHVVDNCDIDPVTAQEHEDKAMYYENFYVLVSTVVTKVLETLWDLRVEIED